jgi:hypothetical protein
MPLSVIPAQLMACGAARAIRENPISRDRKKCARNAGANLIGDGDGFAHDLQAILIERLRRKGSLPQKQQLSGPCEMPRRKSRTIFGLDNPFHVLLFWFRVQRARVHTHVLVCGRAAEVDEVPAIRQESWVVVIAFVAGWFNSRDRNGNSAGLRDPHNRATVAAEEQDSLPIPRATQHCAVQKA